MIWQRPCVQTGSSVRGSATRGQVQLPMHLQSTTAQTSVRLASADRLTARES